MNHAIGGAWVLGINTWRHAIRNRLLLTTTLFGIVLVAVSVMAASVAIYEQARIIIDVGLAAASGVGSVMAVSLCVSQFANELRSRTAYLPLTRPIPRWSFVLGKYLGTYMAMCAVVLITLGCTAVVVLLYGGNLPVAFGWASLMTFVEIAVVIAVALLFSTMAVPILALTYSAGVVLAGNFAADIAAVAHKQAGTPLGAALLATYYVVPNLNMLSVRSQAANDLPVPMAYVIYGSLYGLSYAAITLILAMLIFERRRAV